MFYIFQPKQIVCKFDVNIAASRDVFFFSDHKTIGFPITICTVFRDDNGNGIFSDFFPLNPFCERK